MIQTTCDLLRQNDERLFDGISVLGSCFCTLWIFCVRVAGIDCWLHCCWLAAVAEILKQLQKAVRLLKNGNSKLGSFL